MIVRIALLLVSVPLLAYGAEGMYQALRGGRSGTLLLPALAAIGGAQALLLALFLSVRARRREATIPSPQDTESANHSLPAHARIAQAISRPIPEFRRLLLVNLPAYAAVSALEGAPPLGTQASVRSALAQVLPGITFNEYGLGQFNAPDHTILMDLGTEPQVWAATFDVTGEAAPAALRHLIIQTGWRAYAPKLGRFITAEDLRT